MDLNSLSSQTKNSSIISSELIPLNNELLIFDSENNQVAIRITTTDLDPLLPELTNLGFEVLGIVPEFNIVEGFIDINAVSSIEDLAGEELLGVIPIYQPITNPVSNIDLAENHDDLINLNNGNSVFNNTWSLISDFPEHNHFVQDYETEFALEFSNEEITSSSITPVQNIDGTNIFENGISETIVGLDEIVVDNFI